ncbi:type IV secretory system conjugative DNA transfer family protein [Endozoicomonas montiporae]|uniref:Helicase HerA central domain-containing protein n=1 Tax=Endozoicomonas montiporae CL-33 TaxID=570277 RepID=A0A142BCZ6_9GAMM|nr:type IV secretory system conjugative DNA transfer family protein [Endozoicomonas montiporae]AMO56622.1 hypothetical protein EZMO1_2543 [Endozoicomonas montiporae CL-33]
MKLKPVNPNTQHPNRHTLYIGGSGTGKSQALSQNPEIPSRGARVILWDVNADHAGIHTDDKKTFITLLKAGIKTGRGFRVAYAGSSISDFEWWCSVVWAVLDGDYITYAIAEELSQVCKSAGKATPNAAILLNQGRKFGLRFHGVTQKPQEISKTFYDQCERKFIGCFKGKNAEMMAKYIGKDVTADDIAALQPDEEKLSDFIFDDGRAASKPEIRKLKYKPVKGIKWK